nr:uncharacterized AarF domain-containing protein kinase At1g71810, chloroplastic isoform X2 [Tanacetum cinerariifolium]
MWLSSKLCRSHSLRRVTLNLQRLLQLLSGSRKIDDDDTGVEEYNPYANRRTNSEEVSLVFNEFGSIQDIQPLLNIIPELPPDLQQRLIGLPADLVGKLVSRIVARTSGFLDSGGSSEVITRKKGTSGVNLGSNSVNDVWEKVEDNWKSDVDAQNSIQSLIDHSYKYSCNDGVLNRKGKIVVESDVELRK